MYFYKNITARPLVVMNAGFIEPGQVMITKNPVRSANLEPVDAKLSDFTRGELEIFAVRIGHSDPRGVANKHQLISEINSLLGRPDDYGTLPVEDDQDENNQIQETEE